MCKTTVINIRMDKRYDVYIGRPSKWPSRSKRRKIYGKRSERCLLTVNFLPSAGYRLLS